MTLPLFMLAAILLALAWPLRAQLRAAWRDAQAALLALTTGALILGYLLRGAPPQQAAAPTCPPCAQLPTAPRPHEVDHAPYYIVDPLAPYTAPDLGSAVPAGDVDARVRALDERARSRQR